MRIAAQSYALAIALAVAWKFLGVIDEPWPVLALLFAVPTLIVGSVVSLMVCITGRRPR